MEIPVLVEPVAGNGYVARAGSPFDWSAEGATAEEAVQKLREEMMRRLASGSQVTAITVPAPPDPLAALRAKGLIIGLPPPVPGEHPLAALVGTLDPNAPSVREFRKAVEEYRRDIDNDPDR